VPALESWLITPLWDQFRALLPQRPAYHPNHPLGCHRPRVPDRVIFDKLVQALVFGCGYRKLADAACSATTIRDRRDEWIELGLFARLELLILAAYDRMVGLDLGELAIDGCITKAPCGGQHAGRSPVDRGKQGRKRSVVTEARGIPLGAVHAGAKHPRFAAAWTHLGHLGAAGSPAHPAHGAPGPRLRQRQDPQVAHRTWHDRPDRRARQPAPVQASRRWPVERTNAWGNQFKKLAWNTERCDPVIDAFVAFAHAVITLRRLIRYAWTLYRWDTRPQRRP